MTRLVFALFAFQIIEMVESITKLVDEGLAELKSDMPLFRKVSLSEAVRKIEEVRFRYILISIFIICIGLFYILSKFDIGSTTEEYKVFALILSIYLSAAVLTLWRRWFNWVVGACAAIAFYLFSWNIAFDFNNQENFLRVIGYGGNIKMQVNYKSGGSKEISLYLRTKDALIGLDLESDLIVEIPTSNIKELIYIDSQSEESANKSIQPTGYAGG